MHHGRNRLAATLSVAALAAAVGFLPGTSAEAKPSIEDVQHRVDRLYAAAETASEHYNEARVKVRALDRAVTALKADEARQDKRVQKAREQVQDTIVRQYEGESLSAVGQVVVSDDPGSFVSQLTTMSAFNDLQSSQYDDFQRELKAMDIRREATQHQLDKVAELKAQLAQDKATIDHKLAEAKSLLADLKADQRAEVVSRTSEVRDVPTNVPASGRAAVAVRFALAQVGKPYVYGAAGPSAFDCSGLTMAAWGAAGVGLPHSSSAQFGSGTHISPSQLQPGDLVFYYSPIHHVGMYIGNGMIVHAANPSAGVEVSSLYSMPFSGAVRPG